MNSYIDQDFLQKLGGLAGYIVRGIPVAILIIVSAIVLHLLVARIINFLASRTSHTLASPARRASKFFFIFAAIVFVCGAYGAELGGIWTMLGAVGALIAVGFVAVWSVLSNVTCTIMILFFRPFEIGDDIEFTDPAGLRGKVASLNFAFTTLRGDDGRLLQIPNNLFFQRIIKRHAAHPGDIMPAARLDSGAAKPGP